MSTIPATADAATPSPGGSRRAPAPHRSRRPVQRADAARSLRLVAVSFGVTVVVTRLYLALTGYPQIGGAVYHLAHALWGGLLLLVGGLLVLLWANSWVHLVTAVCVGVGSGLFVDEVGKFITQANDYFTPLAAPIIYAVFLAVLGVATLARHTPLVDVEPAGAELTEAEPSGRRTRAVRTALLRAETLLLPRWVHRLVLIAGSALLGLLSLVGLVILVVLVAGGPDAQLVLDDQVVPPGSRPAMLVVASAGEAIVGVLLLLAAVALVLGRDRWGTAMSRAGLVIALAGVNVALGYLDAELVVSAVVVEFVLLLAVERYRARFVDGRPALSASAPAAPAPSAP